MRRVPTLDGWRAVAILLVLIHHIGTGFYPSEDSYEVSLTRFGSFGVDIFFGLSGLLITKLLLDEEREFGRFDLRSFYVRRAFRILPPCFAFFVVYSACGLWHSSLEFLSSLFFFRNYLPQQFVSYGTGHLWSLSVEEHFYLIWPGLLMLAGSRRAKNIAAGLALTIGFWRMFESQLTAPLFPDIPSHFRTDLRLDALLWGCVAAFVLHETKEREKFARQFRFITWLAAAGILIAGIRYYSSLTSLLVAVMIPLLLAATWVHPEWRLSKVLSWTPLVWIGRISYSLYLWQQLFIMPNWEATGQWWRSWPANLAMTFAAATLSYYGIEKPLIKLGRRVASAMSQRWSENEIVSVPSAGDLVPVPISMESADR